MAYDTAEFTDTPTTNEVRPASASGPAVYCGGATLVAGLEAAAAEFFDGDPTGTGTLKYTLECETANDTQHWQPEKEVCFPNGLFVQVVGDGAVCYVLYR